MGSQNSDLSQVKYLLVDLDGTLLASRNFFLRVDFITQTLRSFRAHGSWLQALKALNAVYSELERPAAKITEEFTNARRAVSAFSSNLGVSLELGDQILKGSMTRLFPSLERHFFPVPGAREFLDWAKLRYTLTLATNPVWPLEVVELRLKWAGIDPGIFNFISHAGIMHACKPSKEYYIEVLNKLNQLRNLSPENAELNPHEYLLIGDDIRKDLPAANVGIPVFILSQDKTVKKLAPIPAKKNHAPAWSGSFENLRSMLELSQARSAS